MVEKLKQELLNKKELRNLDEPIVNKIILQEKEKNIKLYTKLEEKKFNPRSKEFDEFKKLVRKRLRIIYGVFSKNYMNEDKRKIKLNELKQAIKERDFAKEENLINYFLNSHLSTKERAPYYHQLIEKLNEETKFNSVADLGCGFNPIAYNYWKKPIKYFATDISQLDINFLSEFFILKNLDASAIAADLTNDIDVKKIIKKINGSDLCLMLKLLDTLESIERFSSNRLLDQITCKNILISFPKQSISGKNKIKSNRNWLNSSFNLKKDKGYNKQIFEIGPERYILFTFDD